MFIQHLGSEIRRQRRKRALTQQQVATAAGLSRNTLNRLENGLFPDLGVKKAQAILESLGMELAVTPLEARAKTPDYIAMASKSAGVSFRKQLAPQELAHALLSGKVTPGKEAHFMVLLEEAPAPVLAGLIEQAGAWVTPGKIRKNLGKIATEVGLEGAAGTWQAKIG